MGNDLVERLKRMSSHESMTPITIRIPLNIEKEIRALCDEENIRLAVIIREVIARGWEDFKEDAAGLK